MECSGWMGEKTKGKFNLATNFRVEDTRKAKRQSRKPPRENCWAPIEAAPTETRNPFYQKQNGMRAAAKLEKENARKWKERKKERKKREERGEEKRREKYNAGENEE